MERLHVTSIAFLLTVFTYTTLAGTVVRRQDMEDSSDPLYLNPAPYILPAPSTDPAPVVLPAGSIDRAGVVAPAGAIESAPQIAPAPVILPSTAIREKDRAYPEKRRSEVQERSRPRQALEEAIITVQQIWKNRMEKNQEQAQNYSTNTRPSSSNQSTKHKSNANVIIAETPSDNQSLKRKSKTANNNNKGKSFAVKEHGLTRSENSLSSKGFLSYPIYRKDNSTAKFRILKKNGAILLPAKVYAPTPFHFKLDRKNKITTTTATTTTPTKSSAKAKGTTITTLPTEISAKANREREKLKKMKGKGKKEMKKKCKGVAYKPSLQPPARVVPTQTNFIPKGPISKQVNKAPMQQPLTKPTKKTLPQVLAGCSMEPETVKTPEDPTKSSIVKQTLFIPKAPLPKKKSKYGGKFKTKQTLHIQRKKENGRARHLKLGLNNLKATKRNLKTEFKKEKSLAPSNKGKINNYSKSNVRYNVNQEQKRSYKRRQRRQLIMPYTGFANDPQISSLAQQLLSSLPAQPVLSQAQNILGQMLTEQSDQSLLSQPSLFDKQTSLYSPLLQQQQQGLSAAIPFPQQQPIQSAGLPLSPLLPAQNSLSSLPIVSNPVVQASPISYQSSLRQTFIPIAQPRTDNGEARQAIPEVTDYSYEEEYPRMGRRRHHRRRGSIRRSRMRQNPYGYDTYRSFEDTYGESPGIFDDLKDISSEMDKYNDEAPYREEEEGRRHGHYYEGRYHHSRHRRPLYKEYKDYDSEGRNEDEESEAKTYSSQKHYASPEETEDTSPAVNSPVINPERDPVADPVVDLKEEAPLHDAEDSTENAVKDENIRKEKVKEKEPSVELKDDNDDSEETQAKRSVLVKHLDKDAVMHLDFDDQGAQKKNLVKDKTDNNNDATLSNGAAVTMKSLGTCGRGIILKKGEISYNGSHFKRKPTKEVSISMWVKSKNPGFIRWFDESDSPHKSFFASTKSPAVTKNRWTHLVGTFDTKTGVARIYVNGKLKLEKVGKKNDGLPQDFTSTGIGRKFGDSHVTFLDDVYMFDRVISPEEVTALYKKCEFNRMILHYGFQHWNGTTHRLSDQSGLHNNATLKGGAQVRPSDCDKCGACLDLQSKDAQVYLNASKYRRKPTSAVSISAWINLNRTAGLHSIFQALKSDDNNIYNLEVLNGKVHWQSKDKKGDIIFDALTNEVTIPEGLWSHVTGTYSSKTGNAKIYVNGLLRASFHNQGGPKLSTEWSRATIGGHFPDKKPFDGLLDEFFMYNWELDPSEVRFVSKYCADKPKLVSFTVKVPIL